MEPYITEKCPKCGGVAYADGINNGIGYVYEPLHCFCGWSEMCAYQDKETCKVCDQYERCYRNE